MIPSEIDTFLRDRTAGIKHSGRTLYDHLKGTYDLLSGMEALEHVRLAGLFHSIYGTNVFRTQAVSDRNEVREVIGHRAERLVYIFCSCNRPRELIDASHRDSHTVVDRHDGKVITLTPQDMCDLLTIEYANLTEQNSMQLVPQVRDAWLRVKDEMLEATYAQ